MSTYCNLGVEKEGRKTQNYNDERSFTCQVYYSMSPLEHCYYKENVTEPVVSLIEIPKNPATTLDRAFKAEKGK